MDKRYTGPRGKRVTAQDVADRAGVSRHAVSRCFREGTYLAEEKRRLILAAASELGYRPNALASSLKGRGSRLVGIVSGNLSNIYDGQIIGGLVENLTGMGKWPVVLGGGSDDIRETRVLDALAYPLEAMILRAGSVDGAVAEQCRRLGIPLILSGRRSEESELTDSVCCDNASGAGKAVRCLFERGRRRIAYVGGPRNLVSEKERFGGFIGALSAIGLQPGAIINSDFSFDGGCQAATEILSAPDRPDAVLCSNDAMALGVLSTARDSLNLRVPDDVSIIGFDDIPMANWPCFRLTTVRNSISDTIDGILELLADRLENPHRSGRYMLIMPELVPRNTH